MSKIDSLHKMNTFEITFYGRKTPMIVKADAVSGVVDDWITFYDRSIASETKIVAMFSATHVLCVIRKDDVDEQN